ncbi:MAG: methionyl-tRNA formyltransferase [Bacteroidetes bacterium]|nr:methionyl-tRNA formyltransferase [Bacteroidota bacterium]MCL5026551.1 methionyl-tRNA formyltransferase [Chloroflexota bacterium]
MRIVLIGQAAFGEAVLKALQERGDEVIAVYVPPDKPGRRPDPLKEAALAAGIRVYHPPRMRDPLVEEQMKALNADLGVMAFVTDIVPARLFGIPRLGTIQYHPSLLPRHRGGSAINWAIVQGNANTGLTIFWPDGGIDTGPILLQKEVEIGPDDTVGSLYFNKLFPLGVQAMVEAVTLVEQGRAPRIPQDESQATYEPLYTAERCIIDWCQPRDIVYALIRGGNPQPGAGTTFRGQTIRIFDAARYDEPTAAGAPGEVVDVPEAGLVVATGDRPILVVRVQPPAEGKVPVWEWAAGEGVRTGEMFGQ